VNHYLVQNGIAVSAGLCVVVLNGLDEVVMRFVK